MCVYFSLLLFLNLRAFLWVFSYNCVRQSAVWISQPGYNNNKLQLTNYISYLVFGARKSTFKWNHFGSFRGSKFPNGIKPLHDLTQLSFNHIVRFCHSNSTSISPDFYALRLGPLPKPNVGTGSPCSSPTIFGNFLCCFFLYFKFPHIWKVDFIFLFCFTLSSSFSR